MHPHRLEQLVASVPESISREERTRLLAHVRTVDGCRARLAHVRDDLRQALDGGRGTPWTARWSSTPWSGCSSASTAG